MIYKENFRIGLKDIEKENFLTNKAILKYFENLAGYHSDFVKCTSSLNTQENGNHLNWILLDWKVKVIKRPKYGQVLDVRTWSRKITKCYAYRDFEIYNDNEELCVKATSKWVLIDRDKRRIVKVDQEMADKYKSEEDKSVFEEEEIDKLVVPEHFENEISYKVIRKDIDIMGHMHNLYYLDLAYEVLPEEVYEKRPFDEFQIMYKKEITLGEEVVCKYSYENENHVVVIESKDHEKLHAVIRFR